MSQFMAMAHPSYPDTGLFFRHADVVRATAIIRGRFDFERFKGEPRPRYCLDLSPEDGAFAAWAFFRWPYLWFDCIEPIAEGQKLLTLNAPPGTRIFDAWDDRSFQRPDVVHFKLEDVDHLDIFETTGFSWLSVQIVIVEVVDTETFTAAAQFFAMLGFDLKAASATFQTWVRT